MWFKYDVLMWLDVCVCIRVSSSSYAVATHTSGIVDRFVRRVCEAAVRGASRSHLVLFVTVWLINRDIGGSARSGGALTAAVLKREERRCLARMGKKRFFSLFLIAKNKTASSI